MQNFIEENRNFYTKKEYNEKGDLSTIYYYSDKENNAYINLAFKDTIQIERNINTGIPTSKTTLKEQIKGDEVIDSFTIEENYNTSKGILENQKSRSNLIDLASEYLLEDLIAQYGEIDGLIKAKTFLDTVVSEREKYILSITIDLINAIDNTTLEFITTARKSRLKEILNISY